MKKVTSYSSTMFVPLLDEEETLLSIFVSLNSFHFESISESERKENRYIGSL